MRNLLDFLKTYHHWFIFIFLDFNTTAITEVFGFRHRMSWWERSMSGRAISWLL